jgi:branched-chain amino acid transport system ATP-binding protein
MIDPLLLEVSGLSKHYGGVCALNDVRLAVREGEIHALIGPNGAGKTTLIHAISGSLRADAGTIRFAGADLTALAMHERTRAGIARSYQVTSLFPRLSALDNVALAVQARSGSSFSFWRPVESEAGLFEESRAVLARVGLGDAEQRLAGRLAHGEQRRLEVALALATRPRLLLLDEPMAGLSPEESGQMVELIRGLGRELSLLLVEHDMDAVFRLADRISVLVGGTVVFCGGIDEVRTHPEVRRAYLGDDV